LRGRERVERPENLSNAPRTIVRARCRRSGIGAGDASSTVSTGLPECSERWCRRIGKDRFVRVSLGRACRTSSEIARSTGLLTIFFARENALPRCRAMCPPPRYKRCQGSRPALCTSFPTWMKCPFHSGFLNSSLSARSRSRSRAMTRATTSSRRVVATCRDAAGASGYTFH
jgi:hypothetical protein